MFLRQWRGESCKHRPSHRTAQGTGRQPANRPGTKQSYYQCIETFSYVIFHSRKCLSRRSTRSSLRIGRRQGNPRGTSAVSFSKSLLIRAVKDVRLGLVQVWGCRFAKDWWRLTGGAYGPKTMRRVRVLDSVSRYLWRKSILPLFHLAHREDRNGTKDTQKHRILVVDDDPQFLVYVRGMLEDGGYIPDVTADPKGVPGLIKKNNPSLVLLDLLLPDTDGIELMLSVPELADRPVIFVSAFGRDETIAKALDSRRGRLHRQTVFVDGTVSQSKSGTARARRTLRALPLGRFGN